MLRIEIWLAAAGAFIAAVVLAFWRGKQGAKDDGYVETRKRMDKVDLADDPATNRDWLRERGKR